MLTWKLNMSLKPKHDKTKKKLDYEDDERSASDQDESETERPADRSPSDRESLKFLKKELGVGGYISG